MLALEKWGQGRYKPLVIFAHTVASAGEDVYFVCDAAHKPKVREFFSPVDDKTTWLENYDDQAFLMIDPCLVKEIVALSGDLQLAEQAEKFVRELKKFVLATPEERKATARELAKKFHITNVAQLFAFVSQFNKAFDEAYEKYLETVRRDAQGHNEDDPEFGALMQSSMRMRFFFLVAVPCWFELGKSPTELFKSTQSGDFDALRMMLNLDPLCLYDPRILEQFQRHMESNEVRRARLVEAMKYKPVKKLKKKTAKILCAALVFTIARGLHKGVVELQKKLRKSAINIGPLPIIAIKFVALRKLFDVIHKDSREKGLEDPDFSQTTPDGFVLSVKRALVSWAKNMGKFT